MTQPVPQVFNDERCVLTGRAAAEVPARHNDVALFDLLYERLVNILHAVERKLLCVRGVEVTCGNDNIRIDVIGIFENLALCVHAYASLYSVM